MQPFFYVRILSIKQLTDKSTNQLVSYLNGTHSRKINLPLNYYQTNTSLFIFFYSVLWNFLKEQFYFIQRPFFYDRFSFELEVGECFRHVLLIYTCKQIRDVQYLDHIILFSGFTTDPLNARRIHGKDSFSRKKKIWSAASFVTLEQTLLNSFNRWSKIFRNLLSTPTRNLFSEVFVLQKQKKSFYSFCLFISCL